MPLLGNGGQGSLLGSLGLNVKVGVSRPDPYGPDFPEGMRIVEIVNNKEREADEILLVGAFAPHQPFEFGGSQQIVREDYAGSSEPTIQVLGPREDDTVIRGTLKTKRLRELSLRTAAQEYQELMDAMRLRGNLVKITLGGWRRYGFILNAKFRLRTLQDIDYEITFLIVGFNPPSNCKLIEAKDDDLIKPNKEITSAAAKALAAATNYPTEMPVSIGDFIAGKVSDVAGVVATVTGFVDAALNDVANIQSAVNRALGLIRYARAYVSRTNREVGTVILTVQNLGSSFADEAEKTAATITNINHVYDMQRNLYSLRFLLAGLQAKFAELARTVPRQRHLVKDGDTLQRLSITYYGDADSWKRIYDHNKLQSTVLVVGTVLEIPRL